MCADVYLQALPKGSGDVAYASLKAAISHAFSQVLPGLESKLTKYAEELQQVADALQMPFAPGGRIVERVSELQKTNAWLVDRESKMMAELSHATGGNDFAECMASIQKANEGLDRWIHAAENSPTAEELRDLYISKIQTLRPLEAMEIVRDNILSWAYPKIADLTRRLEEAEKVISKSIEMVNIPGTTAATLDNAINAKIMERDGWHMERIEESDAHKARADKAEAERDDARLQINTACAKLVVMSAELEFATDGRLETSIRHVEELIKSLRAERDSLQWTPLSVRKPTAEDADERGAVEVLHPDRTIDAIQWHSVALPVGGFTHWRRTNLPVEKVEQADEFQEWFCKMYGYPTNPSFFNSMRAAWNKARDVKP